jgi:alkyl sulfatase BDS1-like metallo-beta-lactamase superfamily hydrolase
MDLNQLATVERHEAGAEFQLLNPATGEKEDAIFTVQGTDSKAWRKAQKEQRRKFENQEDVDFFDHEYVWPMVANVIIDWKNLEKDGKPFKYSRDNALWLCENSPFVVNQIFGFLIDRDNFIAD